MSQNLPRVTLTKSLSVIPKTSESSLTTSSVPDIFISQSLWRPSGARGVFGGQVIAQALLSACQTIQPPLGLHSQHCYFLLAADASIPIDYQVERLRDGKSYATRLVRAQQNQKVVFVLLASFALPPIDLPPLRTNQEIPFGFQPTQDKGLPPLSNSLRFAVDPNPSTSVAFQPKRSLISGSSGAGFSLNAQSHLPNGMEQGFAERWQISVSKGIMRYEDCELEESRWERFLESKGDELKGKARNAVEEYIQVRDHSLHMYHRRNKLKNILRREKNHLFP